MSCESRCRKCRVRKCRVSLFESSEKRFNQMRNWEVGSGCHKGQVTVHSNHSSVKKLVSKKGCAKCEVFKHVAHNFYRHMFFWFIYFTFLKLPPPPRAALLVYKHYAACAFKAFKTYQRNDSVNVCRKCKRNPKTVLFIHDPALQASLGQMLIADLASGHHPWVGIPKRSYMIARLEFATSKMADGLHLALIHVKISLASNHNPFAARLPWNHSYLCKHGSKRKSSILSILHVYCCK